MRKILLATSALVALAGAAHAAEESPIQVTAGGYVDFRGAMFHESGKLFGNNMAYERRSGDFATEYGLNIAAETKKAVNGVNYGAYVLLDNVATLGNTSPANEIAMDQAYIWMSGAFGKVVMGDDHGASDLFVMAPTVGEGQIAGSYTYFTDMNTLAQFQPTYVDAAENNTKFTYYTPKVGNADHKVQLGISYVPSTDSVGNNVELYRRNVQSYRDMVETAVQYTGNFSPVNVVITPMMAFAQGEGAGTTGTSDLRDFMLWGIGGQASYAGFTFGASYVDAGHYNTNQASPANLEQNEDQEVWTVGLKYEMDKVAVATNYMKGKGYYDQINTAAGAAGTVYVDDFQALGLGATYTWFPGLTSAADAVFFDQNRHDSGHNNIGHVLMLSQKMAF